MDAYVQRDRLDGDEGPEPASSTRLGQRLEEGLQMRVEAMDGETGETVSVEIPDDRYAKVEALAKNTVSDSKLMSYLDRMNCSADTKMFLASLLEASLKAGQLVVRIGKKVVEFAVYLHSQFPAATFGVLLGVLLGAIASAVPILGILFGPLVAMIVTVAGGLLGLKSDLEQRQFDAKLRAVVSEFEPLRATNVAA